MWSNKHKVSVPVLQDLGQMPKSQATFHKPLPPKPKSKFAATPQACEIILSYFAHNNYQDFNTWQQVSHSRIEVEFPDEKTSLKIFKCKVVLIFEDPQLPHLLNIGEGRSKKEAKKQALEKTISQLVWDGYIGFGFKDENFLEKLPRRKRQLENVPTEDQTKGTNQLELSSQLQEINRHLEKHEFDSALELLSKNVLSLKSPEFSQISALWAYALSNNNLLCVRDILLAIHSLPVSHEQDPRFKQGKQTVNALLKSQYGFGRLDTPNSYEIYDASALQSHYDEYQQKDTFIPSALAFQKFHQRLDNELADILKSYKPDIALLDGNDKKESPRMSDKLRKQLKKQPCIMKPPLPALIPWVSSRSLSMQPVAEDIILGYKKSQIFGSEGLIPSIKVNPFDVFGCVSESPQPQRKNQISLFEKFQNKNQIDLRQSDKKQLAINQIKAIPTQIPKFSNGKSDGQQKSTQIRSISAKLLDSLYESSLYVYDYKFAIHLSQMIYTICKVRLDESNTISNPDADFYSHKKNLIVCDFIQKIHHQISLFHMGYKKITLQGLLTTKNNQDFIFTPKQQEYALESKISKKINTNEFEQMIQIAPGEFGLLQSIYDEGELRICCLKEYNPIRFVCPSLKITEPTPYRFIKLTNRKLFDKLSSAALNVSKKNRSLLSKLNTHLIWHYPTCNRNYIVHIVLDWVKNGHVVLIVSNFIQDLFADMVALGLRPLKITSQTDQRQYSAYKPQVVCATINGCASDIFKNATFTRVLIDQANNLSEVMTLLPLAKGCKKVVLVGDPQLPGPLVMSPFAKSKGMGISLFDRLIKQGHLLSNYSNQSILHYSIGNLISQKFYNNELESIKKTEMIQTVKGFPWPSSEYRICIIDIKGRQEYYANSVINIGEAELATHIIASVYQAGFTQMSQMQILTAYEPQKLYILSLLHNYFKIQNSTSKGKQGVKAEHINSLCCLLDTQQSISKDLIVFTACRTKQICSLADPKKINAFMSRAKRGLVIIGNIETLARGSALWHQLIIWAVEKGLIMSAPI